MILLLFLIFLLFCYSSKEGFDTESSIYYKKSSPPAKFQKLMKNAVCSPARASNAYKYGDNDVYKCPKGAQFGVPQKLDYSDESPLNTHLPNAYNTADYDQHPDTGIE